MESVVVTAKNHYLRPKVLEKNSENRKNYKVLKKIPARKFEKRLRFYLPNFLLVQLEKELNRYLQYP